MKNLPFHLRLKNAGQGFASAWRSEANLRIQSALGLIALVVLASLRASALWWAIVILCIGAVISAELANTALESLADRLHPEVHPAIRVAKDCMAGAVLALSLAAIGVFTAFLLDALF